MIPRFLVPDLDARRSDATLPAEEAHHLSRVMRLGIGDTVAVFDGRGLEFLGRVASIGRETAVVTLLDPVPPRPAPPVALTVVQSVLKGEAMEAVVRDCTMVGVEVIQPVVSERTTVKGSVLEVAGDRWRRIALASTKQCGRSRLPEVRDVVSFAEWLQQPPPGDTYVLLEPSAASEGTRAVRQLTRPSSGAATLVVGPEGGWTPGERDRALDAGCEPVSLGRLTLRADAVPLVAAALVLALWDD